MTASLVYSGGVYRFIHHAGDTGGTVLEAINNQGVGLGIWAAGSGNMQSFKYNLATGAITDIVIPNATSVQTFGINDSGQFVVNSDVGQFIDSPTATPGPAVFMPVAGANLPAGQNQFAINVQANFTYFIDPAYASGFEYLAGTGPKFASVTAPTGIAPGDAFQLWLFDVNAGVYRFGNTVIGGQQFTYA